MLEEEEHGGGKIDGVRTWSGMKEGNGGKKNHAVHMFSQVNTHMTLLLTALHRKLLKNPL